MTKLRYISFAALVFGCACLAVFHMIEAEIDETGVLQEPFALLPVGWILIAVGGTGFVAHTICARRASRGGHANRARENRTN